MKKNHVKHLQRKHSTESLFVHSAQYLVSHAGSNMVYTV